MNIIFWILHITAVLFTGFLFLFITIPLHLVCCAATNNSNKHNNYVTELHENSADKKQSIEKRKQEEYLLSLNDK